MRYRTLLKGLKSRDLLSNCNRTSIDYGAARSASAAGGGSGRKKAGGDARQEKHRHRRKTTMPPRRQELRGSSEDGSASSSLLDEVEKIMQRNKNKRDQLSSRRSTTRLRNPKADQALQNQKLKLPKIPARTSPFIFDSTSNVKKENDTRPGNVVSGGSGSKLASLLDRKLGPSSSDDDRSLFDVFSVPEEGSKSNRQIVNENALCSDVGALQQYHELLDTMIDESTTKQQKPRAGEELTGSLMAWLRSEESTVPVGLPSLQHALRNGMQQDGTSSGSSSSSLREAFRLEVESQQRNFREKMNWNDKQMKIARGKISYIANMSAKYAKGQALPVLWEKVKEAGFVDRKLLQNLLYVSANFSSGNRRKNARYARLAGASIIDILDALDPVGSSSSSATSTDTVKAEDLVDRTDEIAFFHDSKLFQPPSFNWFTL